MITDINIQQTGVGVSYKLHQNYPNPFNPVTNINFEMPEAGYVTLKIYDSRGSIVNTIFNGKLSQGSYSLSYDASHLSSGIYFYEMRSGKFVMTKKMVIAK
ncbi:MAG: T9SS type A sorting domain-containing protein [Ignavibacteria bacterium]|nr:T9SS type A sorting domain-containing protein [Ignavibacteria bacterium]